MRRFTIFATAVLTLLIVSTGSTLAQRPWYRGNPRQIIKELETDTDRYKSSLDGALDRSRLNGSRAEDEINEFVKRFEEATDRLRDRAEDREYAPNLAREILERGRSINAFMRRHRFGGKAESDWVQVRNDLNRLANTYNLNWRW